MKKKFPDYKHCIANLAVSVLKSFGIDEGKQSLPIADSYFQKGYENTVIILLDRMGTSILQKNLDKNGFFNLHNHSTYSSVFPPTTVAATTSILNGLTPSEHCWLGWDCYYPQIGKNVTVFSNNETGTDKAAADYNVAHRYFGYQTIADKINENGGQAFLVTPYVFPFPDSFPKICDEIDRLCKMRGKKYIYAYWNEPDHIMHEDGCYGEAAKKTLRDLEEKVRVLCDKIDNAVIVVTADHGQVNSKGVVLSDYPRICECLERPPSIEPRAVNMFVKEEKRGQFESEFLKEFGEKFILWTRQRVIDENLFGDGEENQYFREMIGDYLAIAVDDLSIYSTKREADYFKGSHAGLTADEMNIPFIVIEKR